MPHGRVAISRGKRARARAELPLGAAGFVTFESDEGPSRRRPRADHRGTEVGRIVEVIDDAENTGGFLIVTYANYDRGPEAFDAWVESIVDVELYFDERGWEVEWRPSDSSG
jgi:hypothetical protein